MVSMNREICVSTWIRPDVDIVFPTHPRRTCVANERIAVRGFFTPRDTLFDSAQTRKELVILYSLHEAAVRMRAERHAIDGRELGLLLDPIPVQGEDRMKAPEKFKVQSKLD